MSYETDKPKKSNRGFASMNKDEQRQIASMGGKAAHARGTAHEFTSAEAAEAGRKGGQSRGRSRAARISNETETMAQAPAPMQQTPAGLN
ncbi:MAG: stress protein [Cyanobacteria bacterium SZAS-4]|nr:stress protein [Cyanobacteria bacterium SZAS-4]